MKRAHHCLGFAVLACIASSGVQAQHAVSLSGSIEHIENPRLAATSPGGATVLRVEPRYTYEGQGDRTVSRFSIGAGIERSSNTALVASRAYPGLDYSWRYNWPDAHLELRAGLAESSTRNTEFEDAGRVTVDSRERTASASAAWTQELTDRHELSMSAIGSRVSYDTASLVGYQELRLGGQLTWDASERTLLFLAPGIFHLSPSGGGRDSDQFRLTAGFRTELHPEWSLRVSAGQARTRSSRSGDGTLAGLQLTYSGERMSSEWEWVQDLSATSVSASYLETESLRLRLGFRIAEGSTLSASLAKLRSRGPSASLGHEARLTLDNELSRDLIATLGFEGRRSSSLAGGPGSGWAFRAGLSYVYSGR